MRYGDEIRLLYKVSPCSGDLCDSSLLDSNCNPETPMTVKVERGILIDGVVEALVGMRSGGSIRRAIIPPELAFGNRSWRGVPKGTALIVELCVPYITKPAPR